MNTLSRRILLSTALAVPLVTLPGCSAVTGLFDGVVTLQEIQTAVSVVDSAIATVLPYGLTLLSESDRVKANTAYGYLHAANMSLQSIDPNGSWQKKAKEAAIEVLSHAPELIKLIKMSDEYRTAINSGLAILSAYISTLPVSNQARQDLGNAVQTLSTSYDFRSRAIT